MGSAVALVVAAGRGERLGADGPKALVMCAGRALVEWSLLALEAVADVTEIVVALPPGVPTQLPGVGGTPVLTVLGGAERSHSVRAALHTAGPGELVIVHDAARPLLTPAIVQDCLDVMDSEDCDAAIAAALVADTIKEADGETVVRTLDRSRLWAVQTPQVFRRAALERVLALGDAALAAATDDAALIERAGGTVRLVPAPRANLKVTTPEDLQLAGALLALRA